MIENIEKGGCNLQFSLNTKQVKNIKKYKYIFDEFYNNEKIIMGIGDNDPLNINISNMEMEFNYFTVVDVQQIFDNLRDE